MIVLKFGGTSVGSVENLKKVAVIVGETKENKIVILSAMSGVTNTLQKIVNLLYLNKKDEAKFEISNLNIKYNKIVQSLFNSELIKDKGMTFITFQHEYLKSFLKKDFSIIQERIILAQGEIVSTNLFQLLLEEMEDKSQIISALDFMCIDDSGEPNMNLIKMKLDKVMAKRNNSNTLITQGYICKNEQGNIDNLRRGGSDYTASIIGSVLNTKQIQIWTDIDGMHNNDPRFVDQTYSIKEISFDEAAELAYFGAKILHPQSIIPAKEKNIPVLVKNTFKPKSKGTLIHNHAKIKKIRAIAAKDHITAIKIKSYRMLMAYGFLKKIFEVFEQHQTAIDMISTSEVAVSLTIDNATKLDLITQELENYGNIEIDSDLSIICVAGDLSQNKKGVTASIFNCIKEIPIRMISYGGSNYNLSFLVKTSDKIEVLNLLNNHLFEKLKNIET